MTIIEKIREFINNHILKKQSPKLLMAPTIDIDDDNDEEIDLTDIYEYIKQDKYRKKLQVSLSKLKPSSRKNLMNMIDTKVNGIVNKTHDNIPLIEGRISAEDFISVRRKNVPINKVGQTIITESGYVDISTRKKSKENKYANLYYKEYNRGTAYKDLFEFDVKNERYSRTIKNSSISYSQVAFYANEEDVSLIEDLAQPSEDKRAIEEYLKLTKLAYISKEEQYNIWNVLKINPYLVGTEAIRYDKSGNKALHKSVSVVYRSKKECIVGYRPVIVLIEESGFNIEKKHVYRLLENGQYADNSSFRQNFEGKYVINEVSLTDIQNKIKEIPLSLFSETKNIIRNGYNIPDHYKKIYEMGLVQIHYLGLDKVKQDIE